MNDKKRIDRKEFMSISVFSIGGLISLAMGIPAVAYILGPVLKKQESQGLIPLGAVDKVEIGIPTLFKTRIEQKAGWIVNERELSFYVYTEDGREFIALSNICTHLGCRVRWVEEEIRFFCPCHNAAFEKNGDVAYGPPPRPLDRYEVVVESEQLFVKDI